MAVVSSDKDGVVHAGLLDLVPSRSGTVYKRWLDQRGPFKRQVQVAILDSFQGAAKLARIGPGWLPHGLPSHAALAGDPQQRRVLTGELVDCPPARAGGQQPPASTDSSLCSVNTRRGHDSSTHSQVRFRQRARIGRPKHGVSTIVTVRRPWLWTTTPQVGQPIAADADSTVTTSHVAAGLVDVAQMQALEADEDVAVVAVGWASAASRRLAHSRGFPVRLSRRFGY